MVKIQVRYGPYSAAAPLFTFNLLIEFSGKTYPAGVVQKTPQKTLQERRVEIVQTVQDWLTENCWLLGPAGQNWMLVAGGGLMAYVAALAFLRWRRQRMLRHRTTRV